MRVSLKVTEPAGSCCAGTRCQDSCHLIPASSPRHPPGPLEPPCCWRHQSLLPPTAGVSWLGVPHSPRAVWVELQRPLATRQVTWGAHRAGHGLKIVQHPAPQQVEEWVWPFPHPSPACWGPPLAQPMGHLPLAAPECAGFCGRNAASVLPAPVGQSLPGTLPVERGRGRRRRGNWTSRITAQCG